MLLHLIFICYSGASGTVAIFAKRHLTENPLISHSNRVHNKICSFSHWGVLLSLLNYVEDGLDQLILSTDRLDENRPYIFESTWWGCLKITS